MKTPEQILMPGVVLHAFADPGTLAERLATEATGHLHRAIRERGRALLVVSGGHSPVAFLQRLSKQEVDWRQVDILPADERWVSADSEQRNSRMIRRHLLKGRAGQARFHELVGDSKSSPAVVAAEASERLAPLTWPADVVVLGMGEDGHTASLFPDAPELEQGLSAEAPLVVTMTPPSQSVPRLSLSARALAATYLTGLLLQGTGKRSALDKALAAPSMVRERPVRYFFDQPLLTRPLQVFWSP